MRIIYFFFCLFVAHLMQAQTAKYSNEFIRIGLGADAIGQAGAVAASTNNVVAGYWNPAALIALPQNYEIASMHAEYFAGLAKYDYLGGAFRLDSNSVVALNIVRFGVDDIQNTLNLFDSEGNIDYDRIEKFSVADYAFLLSYARKLQKKGLSIGGNLKLIYRNQGEFASAWGIGLDFALRYQHASWLFAAVVRDVSTTVNSWSYNEDKLQSLQNGALSIPDDKTEITLPSVTLAVAKKFRIKEKWSIQTELDAEIFLDGQRNTLLQTKAASADLKLGSCLSYANLAFLRIGLGDFQRIRDFDGKNQLRMSPFAGIGFTYFGFSLDYALGNIAQVNAGRFSNYFSLRYAFGSNK